MADVKWIKITTDVFDDEKILLIESLPEADSIIVIWFKLLCLAGKQNNSGVFMMGNSIAYTDKMLATIFRRKESTVQLALQTFEQFGMVELIDGVITIPNWGKHQNFTKIEKNNEYMREYMKEYRKKQKAISCKVNSKVNDKVNSKVNDKVNSKANVSALDKNREEKNREDKNNNIGDSDESQPIPSEPKRKVFVPPTVEEVQEYCFERNNNVNAQGFVDFYESKGWMVGKNKMKDWKAAVRTWENSSKPSNRQYNNNSTANMLDDSYRMMAGWADS